MMTNRYYYTKLPESTKTRVCQLIAAMPGLKSREIANRLGINKRELNRFLHNEGKEVWGLYEINWRWYCSGDGQLPLPALPIETVKYKSLQPQTICGILMAMGQLEAIRQIRRLDRIAIEKAFSEEEYSSLPDVLKIELVQRLEQLKSDAAVASRRGTPSLHPLVTFALIVAAIPVLIKLMALLSK